MKEESVITWWTGQSLTNREAQCLSSRGGTGIQVVQLWCKWIKMTDPVLCPAKKKKPGWQKKKKSAPQKERKANKQTKPWLVGSPSRGHICLPQASGLRSSVCNWMGRSDNFREGFLYLSLQWQKQMYGPRTAEGWLGELKGHKREPLVKPNSSQMT